MDEKKEDRFKAYEGSVLDQRHGVVGKRVMRDRTIKIGANGSSEYDGRWSAYGVAALVLCPRTAHSLCRNLLTTFAA